MSQDRNLSGCQVFDAADLPADWDCVPLGNRIELAYGRGLRADDRKPGDVDVFGSNGRVGNHDVALVNGPGVLIGRKGTIGAVHYARRPFWPIDTVYYVVPRAGDNLRFLHYLLDYLPLDFLNAATGVPGLSRRDAYALRGAFPRPNEQAAIVRILGAVDTALERTREAVKQAREVKRALLQRVLSEGLRGESQKKTAIGHVPRSWNVVPISFAIENFQYGLSVPMGQKGKLPILRMGNIQSGGVVLSDLKYVDLSDKVIPRYLLKRGDVLFNRTNSQEWVGKVGIYRDHTPAVFASYLIRLLPDAAKVDNYYLGHVLGSYSAQCRVKRYATPGVQQVNVNATNLGKVLIPLPAGDDGLHEQREIAALLEAADAVIRGHESVIAAQQTLRASLMHDLLTGRARLPIGSKAVRS
jgi:type I restriction enzyme S subunit